MPSCVVVIPVYRWPLTRMEAFSFVSTLQILSDYPVVVAGPDNVVCQFPKHFKGKEIGSSIFPDGYFLSIHSYNRLLMSRVFYSAFILYEYMLIVQLDALVLKDDLKYWCDRRYSYIGAPWFNGFTTPQAPYQLLGVGNGGFSLRAVHDCLDILSGYKYIPKKDFLFMNDSVLNPISLFRDRLLYAHNHYPFTPRTSEDVFWGIYVPAAYSSYRVADVYTALNFSFEVMPRLMYELNSSRLPFGCHAWEKYESDFWIEKLGSDYFDSQQDTINSFLSS